MQDKPLAVVLLSGGLDSTVLVAERMKAGRDIIAVSFDYGQRHRNELMAAIDVASHYRIQHHIMDLTALSQAVSGATSSQTNPHVAVPHGHYADESMKTTVVPNRNMVMLALATAHAITVAASEVAYAAHAGDHAVYPDCRPQFTEAMRQSIALCDYVSRSPLLVTPFIASPKDEIVRLGTALDVPFQKTWSCYDPQVGRGSPTKLIHCGRCGTCVERKEAFQLAEVLDPTEYAA